MKPLASIRGFVVLVLAQGAGWYLQGIRYPDLEVTQDGKSVLARIRAFIWTLIVGLIGAGLSKLVFG